MTVQDIDPIQGTMPLLGHLGELRRRLLISVAALAVASTVAWFSYDHAVAFMLGPYRSFLRHHANLNISKGQLVTTAPLEGFTTRLKVSVSMGAIAALPVWLWQVWRFITPGLYQTERRYAGRFLASALVLFGGGVATAIAVFPKGISWLISVSGTGVAPLFSPSRYFGLYTLCCLVFGLAFIYPVVLVFLQLIGAVTSARLRKWRRYAIILIVAAASVITPSGDPFSFLALAVPLVIFYEASIIVGRLLNK
ncbi:MAG: twin-arginine translocase subunit TatC [Acidimicrobiaceae bacterium]|nr:twin-arginine translocase subunit TatC [Acidimicrobiaceae bacterium]